jgi:hypothetical protein
MGKVLFVIISGIFVGASIYELAKRATTKMEFTHLFEGLVEKEADELFLSALSKNEKILAADFQS